MEQEEDVIEPDTGGDVIVTMMEEDDVVVPKPETIEVLENVIII